MMHLAVRMTRHRVASLVAVACATLGGAALVTATGVLAESGLRSHAPVGRLAGADIVVTAKQSVHAPESVPAALSERHRISADVARQLATLPGVRRAVGDISFPAALLGAGGQVVPLDDPRTAGHGWSSVELLARSRTDGAAPVGADEVALGTDAASATGVDVGDEVLVSANGARARTMRVSAVVRGGGDGVFLSDSTAASIRQGQVDLIGVQVDPGAADAAASAVRQQVADQGLVVSTGAARGDTAAPDVAAARSTLLLVAGSLACIEVMLVGFVVTGAVTVSIAGQRRSLALIRSIGGTPRQVRRLVAAEATAVAAAASVPGIVLGYVVAGQLRHLLRSTGLMPESLPLTFGALPAVAAVLSMLGVAQLAARGASWRMSRTPVVKAIVESSSEARTPSRRREAIGLLVIVGALALATTPLFARSELGAAMTSTAGIVAAIGLAVAGPGLLRRASGAVDRRVPADVSAPMWLAVTNMRVFASRFAGIITASAMLVVFTLTYAIAQTTLLKAADDTVSEATTAQVRVTADALGGVPPDVADEVRGLDGIKAAAPVSNTSIVWPHRVLGDLEIESEPALVLGPDVEDVLDLDVRKGELSALEGDTIAIGADAARSRHVDIGDTAALTLGDGTKVWATIVAIYGRHLGLGSVALSRDLGLPHTTTGLDQGLLVRQADRAGAEEVAAFVASRPGLDIEPTRGASVETASAPGLALNVATVAVLLGYLALTIANRVVSVTTQRRDEIAVLRAVGATRSQILGMTRRESMMAAFFACSAALAVSAVPLALLGIAFLDRPWPSAPIWLVPGTVLLVVGIITTAVELPTRRLLRSSALPGR